MNVFTRCPVHAQPDLGEAGAWACPDDCDFFNIELDSRIEDITRNGNFIRMITTEDGSLWKQYYRNHKPAGDPVLWRPSHRAKDNS